MIDRKLAVQEINSMFSIAGYPEDFLDHYDQIECLASRHGRETFLVEEKRTHKLRIAKCYDAALYKEFEEQSVLRSLRHPGLPEYCGSFRNDRMFIIVRSYIEGVPLSEYAEDQDLTRRDVTEICVKLADILIYLHGQAPPVIHRDIKPENIIITADKEISLIDFDIARTFKNNEETDTVFFGTKGYAPPEQYGFAQTDCRSDIYSFGVLLRYLLTDSVRDNSKIRLYRPLKKIIDRCTAFAPENRYADMNQVRRALITANPRSQALRIAGISICAVAAAAILLFAGIKIYQRITYNPFTDGSVTPLVMPDEDRQTEAVAYLQEKYGIRLFDEYGDYYTVGMLKDTLIEMFDMEEDYVRIPSPLEPPQESTDHFFPWSLDDQQYIDRDYLAYFVTKAYWPDIVSDWSSLREDTGTYPGITIALIWCEDHGILTGVNRPRDVSCGEAAVAFANADKVYIFMQNGQER